MDEKSSQKGHTYVSILTDIDRSRVLDRVPERKLDAAKALLGTLSPTQAASVKAVEGSWLDVPTECKARGFNADAQTVALKEPQLHVRDIYASFGA